MSSKQLCNIRARVEYATRYAELVNAYFSRLR